MAKVKMSCPECEAEYAVSHDLDERMYHLIFCVFCGEEIINEDDDLNMDSEEDEEYDD